MNERQQKLLSAVMKEHMKTARPVGSTLLAEHYHFDVSPATIRNDFMALEEGGYLTHPHTSAGRVPTEQGYQYYVAEQLQLKPVQNKEKQKLEQAQKSQGDGRKNLAKQLAEISDEAVMIAFTEDDFYYTGLAHLFQKPEFAELNLLYNIGKVIDHLDEVVPQLFELVTEEAQVLIGSENPISSDCSLIVGAYTQATENEKSIIGIFGPWRMDYERNIPRLKLVQHYLIR
ncbi:MAG: hypothetical protein A3B74_02305 [Candidatus Kerfeldbacteria bacterium RIFCSPHIGHO2_02_FULL_42_14]|uniref:Heat-inducible transcription repressor HrcA C-terminal domain-containing protein n=1 Tax=Candidatus Kerfeldbacteria bacterium RIFCSPHIGHO2_02_FULL_42_14 TaxID=1798540 RepID=A0A1G2AUD4_9BACT|nr:MAG: hypothetical protein A3B74_02305 [Candidatus Kerfeldbacteria bacterium RIFCSPHIGHO2_02_FULL_42_14]OGY80381.1 MAG: hypothetical protein A3E60_04925 [Candidatus Kerfeldbacteria bacterium RIFCSPHIGHO2_12_FULL_42_13]OGY83810.1 MAG: hypothetical protein A3I91_04450 [Candidatus Kerfeldbacteria bacterium RIFCSPLOWO2_02_FULL_42_19]OGY87123.1 MAG: hypothetical protein A3G01_04560 [Candidatus Kerfeldbacteria bacterium RIFCSPLOWO2_12_FULL_43_9]